MVTGTCHLRRQSQVQQNIEQAVPLMLDMKTLAGVLVKHLGQHEGIYEVAVQLGIALGPVTPGPNAAAVPGAIFGVTGIGLQRLKQPSVNSVDAAEVNPAKN